MFSDDFIEAHNNPADREDIYSHPIHCPANRNTEAKIKDMVCYLTGRTEWTKPLQCQLCIVVPFRLVFNYWREEFVRDYEAAPLWERFFLGQKELSRIIELRGISSFDELIYRAIVYFDRYAPSTSCLDIDSGYQRAIRHVGRHVGKRASTAFAGAWGDHNCYIGSSNRNHQSPARTYNRNITLIAKSLRTNIEEMGE